MRRLLSMLVAVILFASVFQASAFYTFQGHVLSGGISDIQYYVMSNASGFANDIAYCASKWVYNGYTNPLYLGRTYNIAASEMDIDAEYGSGWPKYDYTGWTFWFNAAGVQIHANDGNWLYGRVTINTYLTAPGTGSYGTICHEMGHVFGLNENNDNQYSIMCQDTFGRKVSLPGQDDNNGLNWLY